MGGLINHLKKHTKKLKLIDNRSEFIKYDYHLMLAYLKSQKIKFTQIIKYFKIITCMGLKTKIN